MISCPRACSSFHNLKSPLVQLWYGSFTFSPSTTSRASTLKQADRPNFSSISAIWRLDSSKPSSKLRLTMYMGIHPFKLFVCSLEDSSNSSQDELSSIVLVCCQVEFESWILPRGSWNYELIIPIEASEGDLAVFI